MATKEGARSRARTLKKRDVTSKQASRVKGGGMSMANIDETATATGVRQPTASSQPFPKP